MKFGEKLQKLRKEKGISQEELAHQLNVSRQAVSKWENESGYPEMEKLLMIGNIFQVSMDYLLKEEPTALSNEDEQEYYASREVVRGYLNRDKKDTMRLGIGVMFFVLSGLPVLLFPKQEDLMSVFTMVMIVIGIIIMIMLGMAEEPYAQIEKEPLFFDHDFLKELKKEYAMQKKKYIFLICMGIVMIFAACILALIVDDVLHMDDELFSPIYMLCIGMSIYMFIYASCRMHAYEILVDNAKHIQNKNKRDWLYGITIGIGVVIYIGLGMLYGGIAWNSGWVIPVILGMLTYAYIRMKDNK